MDFVDFETGEYRHFAAARHSCRDGGVLPGNGMLYTFPHSCHCYPMLRGFMGLDCSDPAESAAAEPPGKRLERGPAFGEPAAGAVGEPVADDWPTLRGNPRRSGGTSAPGPDRLELVWKRALASSSTKRQQTWQEGTPEFEWQYNVGGDRLSSPVSAGQTVFVAATDEHRLEALDAAGGEPRWAFTAGGRIDTPPTIHRGLCLFGSRDGWVYCLRAEDGELVWRFRAAPSPTRILAYGQLESLGPVVGGVLVHDGLAYFCAGRHSHADGGIHVYAVEPETGKLVWHAQPDGFTGLADLLVGDAEAEAVRMISWEFDPRTGENREGRSSGTLRAGRLGLLSDEWYERPIALRKNGQQWSVAGETGQMLAFDEATVSGFKAGSDKQPREFGRGTEPLAGPGRLFAKPLEGGGKSRGKDGKRRAWTVELPQGSQVRALVPAGERLFVAGRFKGTDPAGHAVRIYSMDGGSLLDEYPLPAAAVYEGLAVAGDRLYVSLQDGCLLCLGRKKD